MNDHDWVMEFPAAITVCDEDGVIVAMNNLAEKNLEPDGGRKLIGSNLLDCHPEPSRTKLVSMLATGKKHIYTIEKKGVKKMILQSPWFKNNQYAGFVELSFEIPFELDHFVRS